MNLWIIIHSKKMCEKNNRNEERTKSIFSVRCECYDVQLVGVGVDCVVSSCSQSFKEIEILYLRCAHISFFLHNAHTHTHLRRGHNFWLYAHKRAHSLAHNVDEMPFTRFRMCKSMTSTRNNDSDTWWNVVVFVVMNRKEESDTKRFAQKYLHKTNRVNITARDIRAMFKWHLVMG